MRPFYVYQVFRSFLSVTETRFDARGKKRLFSFKVMSTEKRKIQYSTIVSCKIA